MADDIRSALDRVLGPADPPGDALSEVYRRASRAGQRRRVWAAVGGFAVFLAVAAPLFGAFSKNGGTRPAQPRFGILTSVAVGDVGQVTALSAGPDLVWVGGYEASGDGFALPVDVQTGEKGGVLPVSAPSSLAYDGSALWLVGSDGTSGTTISMIDPTSGKPSWSLREHFRGGATLAIDGKTLWVAGAADPSGRSARLLALDSATGAVLKTIELSDGVPRGVLVTPDSVLVAQMILENGSYAGANSVTRVDAEAGRVLDTIGGIATPTLDQQTGTLWGVSFVGSGQSRLVSVDLATGARTTYEITPQPLGPGLAFQDGRVWYVSRQGLVAFDTRSEIGTTPMPLESSAVSLGAAGGRVWVLDDVGKLTGFGAIQ